jgi:hypothetical protein
MPQFSPDQCTFNDIPGMAQWDDSHYREHVQFIQVLAGATPAILLPDYDLLQMLTAREGRSAVINSHNVAHRLLQQICGFTGTDYSQYDLAQEGDFYSFLSYHAADHAQIRSFLGLS